MFEKNKKGNHGGKKNPENASQLEVVKVPLRRNGPPRKIVRHGRVEESDPEKIVKARVC